MVCTTQLCAPGNDTFTAHTSHTWWHGPLAGGIDRHETTKHGDLDECRMSQAVCPAGVQCLPNGSAEPVADLHTHLLP